MFNFRSQLSHLYPTLYLGLVVSIAVSIFMGSGFIGSGISSVAQSTLATDLQPETLLNDIPLQAHPLPPILEARSNVDDEGDYFDRIESTPVGALVWSEFPVRVYITSETTSSSPAWDSAVAEAVAEWAVYFPLEIIDRPELADITIARKRPPPQRLPDGDIRARSALAQYELYVRQDETGTQAKLAHRFEITINPTQSGDYARSAVRHELGHALGIWGHSQLETDALYFSQTRTPPTISDRDLNTLKRIYEQPTRLGWWVARELSQPPRSLRHR
ncbi:MAG: peptidase [Cyanobacteriota bacterium]|nr:peptidase [Cyanobacteriota bacterium]